MFNSEIGSQVAWLIPAAMILGFGVRLVRAQRPPRCSPGSRSGWAGGVVTGLTFSLMAGIFHPYYTVALAPAIAALRRHRAHVLWRHRDSHLAAGLLAAATAFTATWTFSLLARDGLAALARYVVLVGGLAAAIGLFVVGALPRRFGIAVATAAIVTALAGPTAYSLATAATPHTGSIPSAGPSGVAGGFGGGPMGAPRVVGRRPAVVRPPAGSSTGARRATP